MSNVKGSRINVVCFERLDVHIYNKFITIEFRFRLNTYRTSIKNINVNFTMRNIFETIVTLYRYSINN